MEVTNLKANVREKAGRGNAHMLRRTGRVPGIVYGKGAQNLLVEFSEMEIGNVLKNYGEHAVVNLDVNGKNFKTMIKEVQRDPVNRSVYHIDMKYIKDDEKIHADVPVIIKGEDRVRSKGGIVQKQLGVISVETTPDKLPKNFTVDVSNLNIGDKLTVADIEFASEISIASDLNSIIATITTAKESELNVGESLELNTSEA